MKMKAETIFKILMLSMLLPACKAGQPASTATSSSTNNGFPENELRLGIAQYNLLVADADSAGRIPRTVDQNKETHWTGDGFDWTVGFFPGSCWYLYEYSNDVKWKNAAERFQPKFEKFKTSTGYHDLGFVFNCSYGNEYRLTKSEKSKEVLITAANALIKRFNPQVGAIMSWDVDKGWQSKRGWKFPVIIDNMMNLELLFNVSEITGDDKYKNVAIAHANTTMKNHFREDFSSYHVVDYDPETGAVRSRQTAQGYAHESSWARGQAWAVYGFTLCYRFTKDAKYLEQAAKIADYILHFKGTPADMIPYWDYNAPNIPNEPRDASAAAITASALVELASYSDKKYLKAATEILQSLASKNYTAAAGENNHFILKHSVGSIPHKNEIDVPLNYADYYFIEALMRYKNVKSK